MNNRFDELAKGLAQSVTRRRALGRFGMSFIAFAVATLRPANTLEAAEPRPGGHNKCVDYCKQTCATSYKRNTSQWQICWQTCAANCF